MEAPVAACSERLPACCHVGSVNGYCGAEAGRKDGAYAGPKPVFADHSELALCRSAFDAMQ